MDFEKQAIKIGKTVYEGDIKTSAEGSIIVPDVKPDILKVLQVSAEPYLTEKTIENGKITLKGKVRVNVLYLPEGEKCKLLDLCGLFEFCETIKKSEFDENMTFTAVCDTEKVSYKVINSRKIGIDTKIIISVTVSENKEVEMISCDGLTEAEKKERNITFCVCNISKDFEFSVDDDIKLPQGKKAEEILKCDVTAVDKEYKALPGKLVTKGKISASILYEDKEETLQHMDYEMPFTEIFDIEELLEGSDLEVNYEIGDVTYSLEDEETLRISANVVIRVKTENAEEIPVLCDCYFTDASCKFNYETVKMQEVVSRPQYSGVIKQLMQKDPQSPNIDGIYKVQAKPYISDAKVQNGKLMVSGKVEACVLYLSDSEETPVSAMKEDIPFNYNLDCEGNVRDGNKTVLGVECEHTSYTINSKDSVEVRCGLYISGKLLNEYDENIITDIIAEQKNEKNSGITVYFTKCDDSIWEIGKKYNVKVSDILNANDIPEDYTFSKGEKLIIPLS